MLSGPRVLPLQASGGLLNSLFQEYTVVLPKLGDAFESEQELLSWFAKLATAQPLPEGGDKAAEAPTEAAPIDPK